MYFATSLVLLSGLASLAMADCCTEKPGTTHCYDGSPITPCCGKGVCNMFCCNCDGGCLGASSSLNRRSSTFQLRLDVNEADSDDDKNSSCGFDTTFDYVSGEGSDVIKLSDYLAWVGSTGDPGATGNAKKLQLWIDHFDRFDTNNDGKVDFGEFTKRPGSKKVKSDL